MENQKKADPNQKFKMRVLELNPYLPKKWLKDFVTQHSEYDNYEGIHKARNVVGLRAIDYDILEKLEEMFKME